MIEQDPYTFIKDTISKKVFVKKGDETMVNSLGVDHEWLFDFRRVLLDSDMLSAISELFWRNFKTSPPFQIGGLVLAAVPLMTGLIMGLKEKSLKVNGFIIRKSRKKDGLLRMIEGEITQERIILVDDTLNSGKSFIRQVEVIESLGKKVSTVFAILRFRDLDYYTYFHERGIEIVTLFTLDDFRQDLGTKNFIDTTKPPVPMPFKADWYFKANNPNFFYVIPKSTPVIDTENIYFGTDDGVLWAINQKKGNLVWKYKILSHTKKKYIFSSPAIFENKIYFGAHDGNFYALNTGTGEKEWIFMEADWISSSPCIAEGLQTVFVGLEFGLWKKRGGIVALNAKTGEKRWEYITDEKVTSAPLYVEKENLVIIGDDNGILYAFNAKNGELKWKFSTSGPIKSQSAFDKKTDTLIVPSLDKNLYFLDIYTGKLIKTVSIYGGIYSIPLVEGKEVYFSSLDKNLYCADITTGKINWKFETQGRIFASPEIIGNYVYIGSNDGRLYELDKTTGKNTAFFQAIERLTNKIVYNAESKKIFLTTFANEIYCLDRIDK